MKRKRFETGILLLISVLFGLYVYRSIFFGKLLGDPFDSRLMIILHEHWWRWFNGLVEFRDTEFFYPYKTALGYSDAFLVQGIIYSLFRFLNQDLADSWTYTTLFLLFIGNFGWVAVANKFLKLYYVKIIFILTIISSLSFVNYFTLNPNIVGYTYLSWLSLFYLNIQSEKIRKVQVWKWSIFLVFIITYALSCWYGAFFFVFTLFVKAIISIPIEKTNLKIKISRFDIKNAIPFAPFQLFLLWLFYFIYISVSTQPIRPTEEMIRNSPRIHLLPNGGNVNGADLNGSYFHWIYKELHLNYYQEYTIGIGISVLIFSIIFLLKYIKENFKNQKGLIWTYSIIISYLFFVVFGSSSSVHKLFFENFPGFNSIRYPSRYVILIGFYAIFGIFYTAEKLLIKKTNKIMNFLLIFTMLVVFIDQQRSSYIGWDKKLLTNSNLISQEVDIKANCDYFYYDYPGGWWYDQIEAMSFGIQIGIPTINGYSGAFPPNYPTEPFLSNELPLKIFDWISKIDKSQRGCFVTGITPISYFNQDPINVNLIGFTPLEKNQKEFWQWSISPNPYLYIINYSKNKMELYFELIPPSCFSTQDIRITEVGNKDIFQGVISKSGKEFSLNLDFKTDIVKRIEIITKSAPCRIQGDPRELYFEIKNLGY